MLTFNMDTETAAALQDFKQRLQQRFGDKLKGVYLFGSRARGDHRPDSDADVAVVLDEPVSSGTSFLDDVSDPAYDILLEKGLYIQPWVLEHGSLENPDGFWGARLARTVGREGIPIHA